MSCGNVGGAREGEERGVRCPIPTYFASKML